MNLFPCTVSRMVVFGREEEKFSFSGALFSPDAPRSFVEDEICSTGLALHVHSRADRSEQSLGELAHKCRCRGTRLCMSALKVPRPRALSAAAANLSRRPWHFLGNAPVTSTRSQSRLHLSFLLYGRQTWTATVVVASRTLRQSSTRAAGMLRRSLHPHSPRRRSRP